MDGYCKAASGGEVVESTLNIIYTLQGELFLNGALIDKTALVTAIREQLKTNPKLQAVISADQKNEYGKVIEIVDLVKLNGVKTFALNIERETGASFAPTTP